MFGFPPSMDLSYRQIPKAFNPNQFWRAIRRPIVIIQVLAKALQLGIPALL